MNMNKLEVELGHLLNRHCAENASDTPDYILARFLMECLHAWNTAVRLRTKHAGSHPERECKP